MNRTRLFVVAIATASLTALIFGGTAVGAKLITSSNIKDGSIQLQDLSKQAQSGLKGSPGTAGPAGAAGAPGAAGPAGVVGVTSIRLGYTDVYSGYYINPNVYCDAGQYVSGTGYFAGSTEWGFVLSYSTFVGGFYANTSGTTDSVDLQAICVTAASGSSRKEKTENAAAWKAARAADLQQFQADVTTFKASTRATEGLSPQEVG